MGDVDTMIDQGDAHASVNACGISPSASGSASTHAKIRASLKAVAATTTDVVNRCIHLNVTKVDVNFNDVTIHDTSVNINLGPISGVDVSKLADLVTDAAPDIARDIANSVRGDLSKAIMNAAGNIPCMPFPTQAI